VSDSLHSTTNEEVCDDDAIELPAPTVAPLVFALSIALLAAGVAMSLAFAAVGAVLFVVGLSMWISQLIPGQGHVHEPRVELARRPCVVAPRPGGVIRLKVGMPGYRLRLPETIHPISAGVKGGIVGGIVMPLPAMLYGLASGHGIWLPINLLAGMVLPNVGDMPTAQLEQFHLPLFVTGLIIHVVTSLIIGLLYGVLLPTLPDVPKPIAWGALLMPLLWTAMSYVAWGAANPSLRARVDWLSFVLSQLVFGIVAAAVFMRLRAWRPVASGIIGGIVGGLLMPLPAMLWGVISRHGIWYPANLLAAMVTEHAGEFTTAELEAYHADWFATAMILHGVLSVLFGLAFGLVLPRVPAIPGPMAWGGLVMPLLWTGLSYGLMGVVNPTLQRVVEWPWFIASQFVFGVVAAIVVVRSVEVHIPPAGRGPEPREEYLTG
jgi:hypothetical protein